MEKHTNHPSPLSAKVFDFGKFAGISPMLNKKPLLL